MNKKSSIWYEDLVYALMAAKTEEELDGMTKALGFEKRKDDDEESNEDDD